MIGAAEPDTTGPMQAHVFPQAATLWRKAAFLSCPSLKSPYQAAK